MINQQNNTTGFALFNLGFRPFFLAASLHSILVVLVWMFVYSFNYDFSLSELSLFQWHAHEMIYGYSMAVIAGFLLTAVKNWTGIQTIHGWTLAGLVSLWLVSRLIFIFAPGAVSIAGVFDMLFMLSLIVAVVAPVIKAGNWRQSGILFKLVLLTVFNLCFYLGYAGYLDQGLYWGVYGGLYLVIGLILTVGSRVIPFFIERGLDNKVQIANPFWVTIAGMLIFLVFFISELFLQNTLISGISAAALSIVYSIRLYAWHTKGIWSKPLLWGLYLAILFIVVGFLLFALSSIGYASRFIAVHTLAYAGIGMITLSMMARVTIGHTGRQVAMPPKAVGYILLLMLTGSIVRILMPVIMPAAYVIWIIISQCFWMAAFLLFVMVFAPMLCCSRVDGQFS